MNFLPMNEGAMYQTASHLSRLFLLSCVFCTAKEPFESTAVPSNEGAIYQKVYLLSRFNFTLLHYFYFLAATRTKRFFPTFKIYSPAGSSRSVSLTGASFTSTAPC